ncbi:MAG TPA: GtrA family protein [Nitrososphaerales archaeon]|nr:GtrA family protein [Nitrososphaerales archaeon]
MSSAEGPQPGHGGIRGKITDLDKKYNVFKLAKFAIAAGTGFLLSEGILTLGVLLLYGKLSAPSGAYSSPAFLALDVAALGLGVALSLFLNERITVKVHPTHGSLPSRLLKFEGVNALGNATIIGVQFALFAALSLTPVIGNVIGAVVSYPVTYLISMRFVWKPVDDAPAKSLAHHRHQSSKKGGPLPPPVAAVVFLVSLYAVGKILQRSDGKWSRRVRFPIVTPEIRARRPTTPDLPV